MYASASSIHAINLLNIAERNRVIEGWQVLGDLIMLRGKEGVVYVRPEALDRVIEEFRTDRWPRSFGSPLPSRSRQS
ncbi:MAG: hypothetical protein WD205_12600 [Rhodothermales bacterium]